MNSFYHAFTISFNWWYVLLPLQLVLMLIFGLSNAKLSKRTKKVIQRDKKDKVAFCLSIVMTIILMVTVVSESSSGLIQILDNSLSANDDPVWSLFLFVFVMSTFAVFTCALFYYAAKLGKILKTVHLEHCKKM